MTIVHICTLLGRVVYKEAIAVPFTIRIIKIVHVGPFLGIFGRKKRDIDAHTRQCMEQCTDCKPLLLPTQQEMIKAGGCLINVLPNEMPMQ